MSRKLVFLREVSRDFIEGFDYYEALSPGRGGARFEAAFKRALRQVEAGVITHLRARTVFDGEHSMVSDGKVCWDTRKGT